MGADHFLWTFQGKVVYGEPIAAGLVCGWHPPLGQRLAPCRPSRYGSHPCDGPFNAWLSWICWLSNQLADDCEMFCQIKMFFKSQNVKDLGVGECVLSSGPSIDLPVFCSWPDRPWGPKSIGLITLWCEVSKPLLTTAIRSIFLKFSRLWFFWLSFLSLVAWAGSLRMPYFIRQSILEYFFHADITQELDMPVVEIQKMVI